MTPCACGRSFVPEEGYYIAHVQTPEHQGWRARTMALEGLLEEQVKPVAPMYVCTCGSIHWADSRKGRVHAALGHLGDTPVGQAA